MNEEEKKWMKAKITLLKNVQSDDNYIVMIYVAIFFLWVLTSVNDGGTAIFEIWKK
jgi:hypothetical protein